ncbi:c-type cytochrome [bacterium]|nr:c-type cytochrome [bacterium]
MSEIPEQKSNEKSVGTWFLIFSGLLGLFTAGAVYDETFTRRPWKHYQEEFKTVKLQELDKQLQAAKSEADSTQIAELDKKIQEESKKLDAPEFKTLGEKIKNLNYELADLETKSKFEKANSDEYYYFFKHALQEGHDGSAYEQKLRETEKIIEELNPQIQAKKDEIAQAMLPIDEINKNIKALQNEKNVLEEKIIAIQEKIEAASHLGVEIKQFVLADYTKGNFSDYLPKVERCQTCHAGINDPVMAEVTQQPFGFHKDQHELLKKHNIEKLGCTTCHAGQGIALTEHDAHEGDHHWLFPMLETIQDPYTRANTDSTKITKHDYTQSSCFKCHKTANYLPGAEVMLTGKKLVMDLGCNGCHALPLEEKLVKNGPPLNAIAKKTNPEWIATWLKNPRDFYPNTRMPDFHLTDEETESITAFLMDLDKTSDYKPVTGFVSGSASNGKKLVEEIGCQACHTVGDKFPVSNRLKEGNGFGPDLNKVGTKVNATWLYDWLKNPKNYHVESRMPSLRLSDSELQDVTTYLLTLKDTNYKPTVTLSSLEDAAKIEAGRKNILKYGCYGCHNINGTENEGNISVSLADIARKTTEELDFGDRLQVENPNKIEKTWQDWIFHKIKEPRDYTTERIKSVMPSFGLSDEEAHALTVLMKGWILDFQNQEYAEHLTPEKKGFYEGQNFIRQRNCVGCHLFEGEVGGLIYSHYENPDEAPPKLMGQGDKTQEDWLTNLLNNVSPIRPWLKIRMPSFGFNNEQVTTVHKYFQGAVGKEVGQTYFADFKPNPENLKAGEELFNIAQCTKCHLVNGVAGKSLDPSSLAPDLGKAKTRLKPDWIVDWLKDPQAITPGTKMPGFFYYDESTGERYPLTQEHFEGNADKQIIAIRDYVVSLSK